MRISIPQGAFSARYGDTRPLTTRYVVRSNLLPGNCKKLLTTDSPFDIITLAPDENDGHPILENDTETDRKELVILADSERNSQNPK